MMIITEQGHFKLEAGDNELRLTQLTDEGVWRHKPKIFIGNDLHIKIGGSLVLKNGDTDVHDAGTVNFVIS